MKNSFKDKKVLITGGLGMIGSNIAEKLLGLGAHVMIYDAMLNPFGYNLYNIKSFEDRIVLIKGDIRDKNKLMRVIEPVDFVFNLAGQVSHNDSLKDPLYDTEINYIGHLNVLEAVRLINPAIKILYSGSRLEYGKILSNPVSEDHPLNPLTPYAVNKSTAEQIYLYYHRMFDVPVVLFRISNPYGPRGQIRHSKYCMVNWFTRLALENKTITVFGTGEQRRDYIYIDDLVDAFVMAAYDPATNGKVFNLGAGKGVQFKDMVETVVETVGSGKVAYVPWPDDYINVETGDFIADISKLKAAIRWEPKISLNEGIQRTHAYYRKYMKHYK